MEYNNQVSSAEAHQDILNDDVNSYYQFTYATQGQRFLNWLIDNLFLRFALTYVTGAGVGFLLGIIAPDFMASIIYDADPRSINWSLIWIGVLIGYINYIFYYTLCEKLFKGVTLGKLITGTKALRQDGQELTFKDAILRSLSRCVPFEVFSGFNTLTWHDQWTDTMVVKSR